MTTLTGCSGVGDGDGYVFRVLVVDEVEDALRWRYARGDDVADALSLPRLWLQSLCRFNWRAKNRILLKDLNHFL